MVNVNINQLRRKLKSLESQRDFLVESRDFEKLNPVLDEIKIVKNDLAIYDVDSVYAHELRIEKAKKIFKGR